jgi:hypothetical protein
MSAVKARQCSRRECRTAELPNWRIEKQKQRHRREMLQNVPNEPMALLARVLLVLAALFTRAPAAMGQARVPSVPPPQPTIEKHSTEIMTTACATISSHDVQLQPLSRLCEFALSYRRSLPNFICEEETVSRSNWPGGPSPVVTDAQVTYQDGIEKLSNVRTDGVPETDKAKRNQATFKTYGEFGNELIDLFSPPARVAFRYERPARLGGVEALVFSLHLPRERNTIWTVGDGRYQVAPEFQGEVWIETGSSRLLRLKLEPMNLPRFFMMESAEKQTDYGQVNLGELGAFLLPVRATSRSCFRSPSVRAQQRCMTNTVEFRNCSKFAGKARIVESPR